MGKHLFGRDFVIDIEFFESLFDLYGITIHTFSQIGRTLIGSKPSRYDPGNFRSRCTCQHFLYLFFCRYIHILCTHTVK